MGEKTVFVLMLAMMVVGGEILKSDHMAADAGSSVLSCYLYDPVKDFLDTDV